MKKNEGLNKKKSKIFSRRAGNTSLYPWLPALSTSTTLYLLGKEGMRKGWKRNKKKEFALVFFFEVFPFFSFFFLFLFSFFFFCQQPINAKPKIHILGKSMPKKIQNANKIQNPNKRIQERKCGNKYIYKRS